MSKKCKYVIKAGKETQTKDTIRYLYGQTSVELNLSPQGFYISYERPITDKLLKEGIVRDAIRKAELLCVLRHSKSLKYERVDAIIDGKSICLYNAEGGDATLLYRMFSDTLTSNFSDMWRSKSVQENIANTAKSNYDRRYAALFALIMAKSKAYEMERFMYLWMAINALYGFMTSEYKKGIRAEWKQLQVIASYYGFKYESGPDYMRDLTRGQLMGFLENLNNEGRDILLSSVERNEWDAKSLQEAKCIVEENIGKDRLDPMGTFLLWLPYQLRCKYFHGEKAVPIMSFSDERPITALGFINRLLETFLDRELANWLEPELIKSKMMPKLKGLELSW